MAVEIKMKSRSDSSSEQAFRPFTINGYQVDKPFTSNDSGFSKWGFCKKYGNDFFIKEFLTPKYPAEDAEISETRRKNQINECEEWFAQHSKVYNTIMRCNGGNMVVPLDFFKYRNNFYLVTEKINANDMGFSEISRTSHEQKHVLMMILANEFSRLEAAGVVHSDIKPNNLMLKATIDNFFTVKVIDFDNSFLQDNVPYFDELHGDLVYFPPETILYIDSEGEEGVVTTKADVFSVGIVFHQLLCGELPKIDSEFEYSYIGEAVLNDEEPVINNQITAEYKELIRKMLLKDPEERISMREVFKTLYRMVNPDKEPITDFYYHETSVPAKTDSEPVNKEDTGKTGGPSPWKTATFD